MNRLVTEFDFEGLSQLADSLLAER
jgi:hypothetical protein